MHRTKEFLYLLIHKLKSQILEFLIRPTPILRNLSKSRIYTIISRSRYFTSPKTFPNIFSKLSSHSSTFSSIISSRTRKLILFLIRRDLKSITTTESSSWLLHSSWMRNFPSENLITSRPRHLLKFHIFSDFFSKTNPYFFYGCLLILSWTRLNFSFPSFPSSSLIKRVCSFIFFPKKIVIFSRSRSRVFILILFSPSHTACFFVHLSTNIISSWSRNLLSF